MIINEIRCERSQKDTSLRSIIEDETTRTEKNIFFSVPKEYEQYLVDEVSDSFVLACLLPALVSKQDIIVKGGVSDHFYYHFKTIIYLLGKVFGYPPIQLYVDNIVHVDFSPKAVATGFSGGVDSLATYISHTSSDCPQEFQINQLALFNVGSYGNDYAKTSNVFHKDVVRAECFAQYVKKPLVLVDSNIGELYSHKDIYSYSLRSTLCLSTGILILQKLFKYYFISSSGTIDDMKLSKWDQYFYENSLVQLLSNNNVSIFISEADLNRVQKTKLISKNELSEKFLYVCASDIYNEKWGTHYDKGTFANCCECIKCGRTLMTLDLLGVLENYATRFDLKKYLKIRDSLFLDIILNHHVDHFKSEIYELMQETGFKLSSTYKWKLFIGKIKSFAVKIYIKLKR